jgi:PAS domain-containing protein
MNRLAVQFLDQGFHRMLFDAMPMPVFVVDEDVCILECNPAATSLLGKNKQHVVGKRCGEVLNCVHARETPEGCGRSPDCGGCVVRQSVQTASQGRTIIRQEVEMKFGHNGKSARAKLRVTCQPFTYERRTFILLILEGLD